MKTLFSTALAVIFIFSAFGQVKLKEVKQEVGHPGILQNWKVGEQKEIIGASIIRTGGENSYNQRTNVFYFPSHTSKTGGRVALFIDRETREAANGKLFSVKITNDDGDELFSKCLESKAPKYYIWDLWYNYITVETPGWKDSAFNILVMDNSTHTEYMFRVILDGGNKREDNSIITQSN